MTAARLRELLVIAMAIVAIWLVAGIFATSEFYRRCLVMGGAVDQVYHIFLFQMVSSLNWALFTPVIIAVAERLPLRKPHLLRNSLIVVALLPVIGVLRASWGGAVLTLCEDGYISMAMQHLSLSIRTHSYTAIAAMIVILTNLVLAQREAAARARREIAAKTLLARAELDVLRAQVQPQLLFLGLQTIAGIVETEPVRADEMIVKLAGMLRRSLKGDRD